MPFHKYIVQPAACNHNSVLLSFQPKAVAATQTPSFLHSLEPVWNHFLDTHT